MGAVVTGTSFVELARLKFCVGVVLSGSPVGLSQVFVWAEQKGKCFVELARLAVLFRVGLEQLFCWSYAFGLSRWAFMFLFV